MVCVFSVLCNILVVFEHRFGLEIGKCYQRQTRLFSDKRLEYNNSQQKTSTKGNTYKSFLEDWHRNCHILLAVSSC
eukprot:m.19237 g.19237  ORF g.19237 m.19237 type:complete len:76 (+) comp27811_c0_seq8:1766-1993(+)